MAKSFSPRLSRRESEIMDIIFERGEATASQVREAMADAPSYSAVRALLAILEEKGHLRHLDDGVRYIFLPTQPRQNAARSALQQVLQTFFGGSVEKAVSTLISHDEATLSDEELERLETLIRQAREGKTNED